MSKQNKSQNQNSKPQVGRPAATLKYPSGKFTVESLQALNPDLCTLTVRNHINRGLKNKTLTRLKETRKTDGVGRPSFVYAKTSQVEAWKKTAGNLKQGRKTAAPAEPVAAPAAEPVAAPAAEPVAAPTV